MRSPQLDLFGFLERSQSMENLEVGLSRLHFKANPVQLIAPYFDPLGKGTTSLGISVIMSYTIATS
jgi:hypothetical protein